jgi:hypothetical protein
MIKKFLLVIAFVLIASSMAIAETATLNPPTTFTDGSAISGTLTHKIYEGNTVVCTTSTGNSCTFTGPACESGVHNYTATTTSSKYPTNESVKSSPAYSYTAPVCSRFPNPPSITIIVKP